MIRFTKQGTLLDLSDVSGEKEVPHDQRFEQVGEPNIFRFQDFLARYQGKNEDMTPQDLIKVIARLQQWRFNLSLLSNSLTPRTVTVTANPTLLIPPNKFPRGYILLNPTTTVAGVTTDFTLFPSAARGAGTYLSASINVKAFRSLRFFNDITVSPATLALNALTQDPVTAKFAVSQSSIIAGNPVAIGTYYANIGDLGVDDFFQLQVVQTGNGTWSVGMVAKESYNMTLAPPPVYLGNRNVTTGIGYPLLGGMEKSWILDDNTPLYGVATIATPVQIFELQ